MSVDEVSSGLADDSDSVRQKEKKKTNVDVAGRRKTTRMIKI